MTGGTEDDDGAPAVRDRHSTPLPAPSVRFESVFVRIDRALAWIDGLIARFLPADVNPLARSGAAANLSLVVATLSGIALLIWYSPSVQFAYTSVEAMRGGTLGGWVRALHRYSSDLAMLLLFVHAGRTFFARKFTGARWLPWISGVALIGLVWFIGWTGYWLVWDKPAQEIAISTMRFLDALPVFGEPMARSFLADRLVPSLLFFVVFFLHMLLPLGIAIGLAVHLLRLSRVKLLPGRTLSIALVAGMAIASLAVPAPLDEPARMAEKAAGFTVDAWYLTPLALGLRFQQAGLWVALLGTMALAASIPWLFGRRRPRATFQATVDVPRCHSCLQCSQDCPFDAISMVARTDGKRFASQASVDPLKCVGCGVCGGSCDTGGIGMPWFDTYAEEARIEAALRPGLTTGDSHWVAFVCGDIDGGIERFRRDAWESRLPGYAVQPVPTSSWLRPLFVERLLSSGVKGVLVVRDSSTETNARDAGRWVADRLARLRSPKFRPASAGAGRWRVVDFNPSLPSTLTAASREFRSGAGSGPVTAGPSPVMRLAGGLGLAVLLAAATIAPSHLHVANPAYPGPEFVFSMKAMGDSIETKPDAAAEAAKPLHMRGRSTEKARRKDVRVRLTVAGVTEERAFAAKGISNDGPAIGEWRMPLTAGEHAIRVEIIAGAGSEPRVWSGTVTAEDRRYTVLTFEHTDGFRLE